MRKVAITGANGFTGQHLAALLASRGYAVHGLVHGATDRLCNDTVTYQSCDILDISSLAEMLSEIRPDKIVHLAAVSFVAQDDVQAIYDTNVVGTRNLLQAVLSCRLTVDAILVASSANIYGNQSGGVITERNEPGPVNDYAVSKLAMEYVTRMYDDRLPVITARPFNYTGVGQDPKFLVPKIVDHVRRRAAYIELGNLEVARDFSDVRAVVAAYAALLEEPRALRETYNICSGRAYTLNEVLAMVKAISGYEIEVRVNPAFVRDNEVRTLRGSRQKLDSLIKNLPNQRLEETLRWMLHA